MTQIHDQTRDTLVTALRQTSFGCQILRARLTRIQITDHAPADGDLDLASSTITLPASADAPAQVLMLAGLIGRYFAARIMEPYTAAAHELDMPRVAGIANDLADDLDYQFRAQIALEMVHRKQPGYADIYQATRKRSDTTADELKRVSNETLLEEMLRLEIGALDSLGLTIDPSMEDHNWPILDELEDDQNSDSAEDGMTGAEQPQ